MPEARELADTLEENLDRLSLGAANIRPEVVEVFSELASNAAEHGMSDAGARAHARFLSHRWGHAFDVVVTDQGTGSRATMQRNPRCPGWNRLRSHGAGQAGAGVGHRVPTRGIGLGMTVTGMRKPGGKLWIHSGSGLLTMYGAADVSRRKLAAPRAVFARPSHSRDISTSHDIIASLRVIRYD